jgi:5-methylcytosine-specific restriction endonuclease McrA
MSSNYDETHRAKKRAYNKSYYAMHREQKRAASKAHYAANRTDTLARQNLYNATHREQRRAANKAYYLANREQCIATVLASKRKKRDIYNAHAQHRRAIQARAPRNDLTRAEWDEIKAAYGHCCVYCGRKMQRLTQDHLTPLSKGGSHTKQNVVPACGTCNSKKGTGTVLCPVQPLLL